MPKIVIYDGMAAYYHGVCEHPQRQMKNLGYRVIECEADSMFDRWRFVVEDYIEPFPPYIRKSSGDKVKLDPENFNSIPIKLGDYGKKN